MNQVEMELGFFDDDDCARVSHEITLIGSLSFKIDRLDLPWLWIDQVAA